MGHTERGVLKAKDLLKCLSGEPTSLDFCYKKLVMSAADRGAWAWGGYWRQ